MEVIKFGGTALQTLNNRNNVLKIIQNKERPIFIICSAMGRMGFPYSTKTLMSLVDSNLLKGNELGVLLSCGEIISSIVLLSTLRKEISNTKLITYDNYPINKINDEFVLNNINYTNDDVFVIPGFIVKKDGVIDVLNMGESDLSAILICKILDNNKVSLYKDTDGIYPFYPKLTYNIKPHRYLSYDEAILLNKLGYNIVNENAIEYAKKYNIEINIFYLDDDKVKTTISEKVSENEVFGFTFQKNNLIVATRYPCKVKEFIEELFDVQHIIYKSISIDESFVNVTLMSTQILNAKRLLVNNLLNK